MSLDTCLRIYLDCHSLMFYIYTCMSTKIRMEIFFCLSFEHYITKSHSDLSWISSFKKQIYFYFMCTGVLPACVCVWVSNLRVLDSCELPRECWELNLCHLEEHSVFSVTEPFLQYSPHPTSPQSFHDHNTI